MRLLYSSERTEVYGIVSLERRTYTGSTHATTHTITSATFFRYASATDIEKWEFTVFTYILYHITGIGSDFHYNKYYIRRIVVVHYIVGLWRISVYIPFLDWGGGGQGLPILDNQERNPEMIRFRHIIVKSIANSQTFKIDYLI